MDCGRKPECREKGALGEHANYSQKDISPDFEPRPSCCVAKEQTSTPLWLSPSYNLLVFAFLCSFGYQNHVLH